MPNTNYSTIIDPASYNLLMSTQHQYISTSDKFICTTLFDLAKEFDHPNVLEIGSGPFRITGDLWSVLRDIDKPFDFYINEIDPVFLDVCQKSITSKNLEITILDQDIAELKAQKPFDIAISQGTHHHLNVNYLKNVYNLLSKNGYYIISDEFLANYSDENDRKLKAIIWYSKIINHAKKSGFAKLAREETKTLLDDLGENKYENHKSQEQIEIVLEFSSQIVDAEFEQKEDLAKKLLLNLSQETSKSEEKPMYLSRGDYKISTEVFLKQCQKVGFEIQKQIITGDPKIGAMVVFVLKK